MIRLGHLSADLFGLDARSRRALSGQLKANAVATRATEVADLQDRFLPAERQALAKQLEEQTLRHSPHVRVLESIRSLATPRSSCAVVEASPFVLGGPLSQLFGALQVIALAGALSTAERSVVPVLWLQSDTHEAAPLLTARVLNRHHALQGIHLNRISPGTRPVHSIELDARTHGLGSMREALRQLFGDYAHITEALEIFIPKDGESLSRAFVRAMYALLGDQGLVVIEPLGLREELSRAAAECVGTHLLEELKGAEQDGHGLENADKLAHAPWLYRETESGRSALSPQGNEFSFEREPGSRTRAELAAELVQAPQEWHVAPLLESATRAAVLPVIAEVGGPPELDRHLLFHRARTHFDWPTPAFVPRLQGTLIDSACLESLGRLELSVEQVLRSHGEIETHGIAPQAEELLERLDQIAMETRLALREQKPALLEIGPTLKPALRVATTEVTAALAGLKKKVAYVAANRGGKLDRHRRRLSHGLCPLGRPQAESLSPFPWIAQGGTGWVGELLRDLDPFSTEHLVVYLE